MAKTKVKRGPRGKGTIFRDKRTGGWRGRKVVGKSPTGKTLYIERSAPTQAEVQRKLNEAVPASSGTSTSFRDWVKRWLAALSVRPSTLRSYKFSLERRILPDLGHLPVGKLTAYHFEEQAKGWDVASDTSRTRLRHVRLCLGAAVRAGLVAVNVAANAKLPKVARKVLIPFTGKELARIIKEATKDPLALPLALLAATGCRVGEALALDTSDVDFKRGMVSITKTQDHSTNRPGPPKSSNGRRTIRVPKGALPALRLAVGKRHLGPLYLSKWGRRMRYVPLADVWVALLERLGLSGENRTLHSLRHSVGTQLVSAGVPIGDVAKFLGDTPAVVIAVYLHAAGTDPAKTLERLMR
jgi:integrase